MSRSIREHKDLLSSYQPDTVNRIFDSLIEKELLQTVMSKSSPAIRINYSQEKESVRQAAKRFGADVVGFANIERFRDAPPHNHPSSLMPEARTVIVVGRRVLRGLHRPVEEGTGWHAYNMFGYGGLSLRYANHTVYELACFVEDFGWQALPHSAHTIWGYRGRPQKPWKVGPEVCVTLYYAAFAAGLGEMGWSKVLLNPEYGPMLRFALVITDAPYEPDPLFEGRICDGCKLCVKHCPGKAIHPTESESVDIGGKKASNGKLNQGRCLFHHWGLSETTSQFLPDGVAKRYEEGMTMEDVVQLREKVNAKVPIYDRMRMDSHTQAICGSQGCCLVCVRHLESKGLISKRMHQFTCPKEEKAKLAVPTHRKVFLPGESIPDGFVEDCAAHPDDKLSTNVEGVG